MGIIACNPHMHAVYLRYHIIQSSSLEATSGQ